uniref:Uncharacterized protein n=1 Tax=Anguilla anguilla TaxID=7936 RepID=A0A0E9RSW6_ANGAN
MAPPSVGEEGVAPLQLNLDSVLLKSSEAAL